MRVEATQANAALNGVAGQIDVDMAMLDSIEGPFDVVVANILAPVLVALAPDLRRLTARGRHVDHQRDLGRESPARA